ncbi:MAG: flagellar basal body P-ring formation chaperone FlgA [Gammaproteobacteria bacterium]|nr:MAG: flagellar basal body P-ring formation chaperone FlgA [Gammaproteobacteria bacterium]
MKERQKISSFFILLAILAWQPAQSFAAGAASQWQSHAAIRDTAQSFLEALAGTRHQNLRSEVRLGKLDSRLHVKTCESPLEAFMSPGGRTMGNTTVGVRCPDVGGWSIYVAARVDIFGPVLVARQPLTRGATVQESDLETVEHNLSTLPYGYYTDSQSIVGQLAKRTITSATVLTPHMLQTPKLVKRGQRVTLIAETGPLKIRSSGKAMSDGKFGDLVQVKSDGSRRVVDGIVISAGVIKVTL